MTRHTHTRARAHYQRTNERAKYNLNNHKPPNSKARRQRVRRLARAHSPQTIYPAHTGGYGYIGNAGAGRNPPDPTLTHEGGPPTWTGGVQQTEKSPSSHIYWLSLGRMYHNYGAARRDRSDHLALFVEMTGLSYSSPSIFSAVCWPCFKFSGRDPSAPN